MASPTSERSDPLSDDPDYQSPTSPVEELSDFNVQSKPIPGITAPVRCEKGLHDPSERRNLCSHHLFYRV